MRLPARINVLVVDASADDAGALALALGGAREPHMTTRRAATVAEALAALVSEQFDAIVLELELPDAEGLDALTRILDAVPDAVIVVRTGLPEQQIAIEALAAGAQDYLRKDAATDDSSVRRAILFALARSGVEELRDAERALRASRGKLISQGELLASVFDNAPIGMAIGDLDGRFTRVNRSFCELLGYSEGELLQRGFTDITHPDDVQLSIDWGQRLMAGEARSFQLEKRYMHRDGHSIWVNLSVSMIYDDVGVPINFVSQFEDISERKAAELAVLRERDHSAAIIAAMGEGYVLTVGGRISVVNDALLELTGFARDELIGTGPPWPFSPPEAVSENSLLRDSVLAGGGSTFEVQMVHKDRTRFVAEVTARPAHNPDGSVLGWVSTVRDISERRRYEAELERLATHDPLTGLPNHRTFHQRLDEELANAIRHARSLSIALVDIDGFKSINDGHGHIVGDRVLAAVAQRLAAVVRQGEMLARVGGEEFAWILPDSAAEGAMAAAERARSAVNTEPFVPVGRLTVSIGVAELDELRDRSRLYQCADESLYEAKRLGRDRVVRFGVRPGDAA